MNGSFPILGCCVGESKFLEIPLIPGRIRSPDCATTVRVLPGRRSKGEKMKKGRFPWSSLLSCRCVPIRSNRRSTAVFLFPSRNNILPKKAHQVVFFSGTGPDRSGVFRKRLLFFLFCTLNLPGHSPRSFRVPVPLFFPSRPSFRDAFPHPSLLCFDCPDRELTGVSLRE